MKKMPLIIPLIACVLIGCENAAENKIRASLEKKRENLTRVRSLIWQHAGDDQIKSAIADGDIIQIDVPSGSKYLRSSISLNLASFSLRQAAQDLASEKEADAKAIPGHADFKMYFERSNTYEQRRDQSLKDAEKSLEEFDASMKSR